MFNPDTLSTKLYGVVGLRQPFNPAYQKLDAANQISRSGYFVTDNPMAKIEYMFDNVDFKGASDVEFNLLLKQMQEESIKNVAGEVFDQVDYIDRNLLYRFAQNKTNTDTLPDGFVGYRIRVEDKKNVAFEITRVLLDFDLTGSFELMLFNTSEDDPIFTKTISITGPHQEEVLNWAVDNSGNTYKGEYYLGYVSNGTVKPFERRYENASILSLYSYLNIWPVKVPGHTGTKLFDLTIQEGLSEATGLNPDITVYNDYTDLIVQNERLFAPAINFDLQINALTMYLSSLRSNRNERSSERRVMAVLQAIEGQDGEGLVKITGLRQKLAGSLSRIRNEVKKLQDGYFGKVLFTETLN